MMVHVGGADCADERRATAHATVAIVGADAVVAALV